MAMALTKNHPMDTILTTVMTPTNQHPTDPMVTTRTNHHLTDTILISHHTMNMKNLKKSHTNLNTSKSHTMIMKNLLTRIHMNQNMNQSRTNQNMSQSHTMIMKPLITIPMSPMIITQSLSMSISKNIPIHLPNTSMATNNLSTRNVGAVIIIT